MDNNSLIPYSDLTSTIAENANKFTELLSTNAMQPISQSLSIIPNVIADITNFILEYKKMKIDERTTKEKINLVKLNIALQEHINQKKYSVEIAKINSQTKLAIRESDKQKEVRLAEIDKEEHLGLEKIQSDERIRILEIQNQYELSRQRQDNERIKFLEGLKASNDRFYRKIENVEKFQVELNHIIGFIITRISNGYSNSDDYETLRHLTSLKAQSLKDSFDISEGFLKMFSGE